MANTVYSFDSELQGTIVNIDLINQQDAKFDYYGLRLATAGLDGKINIFEVNESAQKKVAEISGYK